MVDAHSTDVERDDLSDAANRLRRKAYDYERKQRTGTGTAVGRTVQEMKERARSMPDLPKLQAGGM